MKPKKLTRSIFVAAFILAATVLAGSGAGREPATACQTCFSESATAYQYCHANPTGVYEGCNFTHACTSTDTATSIYREECLLSGRSSRR